jgi:hypothetical protein
MQERQSKQISEVDDPQGKFAVFRRGASARRTVFTRAHDTLAGAQDEALRLALQHLDSDTVFYVAQVICCVQTREGKIVAG